MIGKRMSENPQTDQTGADSAACLASTAKANQAYDELRARAERGRPYIDPTTQEPGRGESFQFFTRVRDQIADYPSATTAATGLLNVIALVKSYWRNGLT